jgi:hypothetical protein
MRIGDPEKNQTATRMIVGSSATRVVITGNRYLRFGIGGVLFELETRAHVRQLVEEILRRKALSAAKP